MILGIGAPSIGFSAADEKPTLSNLTVYRITPRNYVRCGARTPD